MWFSLNNHSFNILLSYLVPLFKVKNKFWFWKFLNIWSHVSNLSIQFILLKISHVYGIWGQCDKMRRGAGGMVVLLSLYACLLFQWQEWCLSLSNFDMKSPGRIPAWVTCLFLNYCRQSHEIADLPGLDSRENSNQTTQNVSSRVYKDTISRGRRSF